MKVEYVELMNFCQHGYKKAEFSDGLTAIIGPNGSGKSNILGAVRFSITGENPNAGKMGDNVYDLAPATEASYVRTCFSHGSIRATVQRNIRPSSPTAELEIHTTGERIEGARDVNARILQILGISTDIINEMVIVGQDDIFGFLDKTPAKRADAFQKLFHTEKAAVLYKLIGDQLKTVEIPSTGVDIDATQQAITEAENQQRMLTASLADVADFADIQRNRDLNSEVIQHYHHRERLQSQIMAAQQRREQQQALLTAAVVRRDKVDADIATIRQSKMSNTESAAAAAIALANLEQWRKAEAQRAQCRTAIEAADASLHQLQQSVPTPPEGYTADAIETAQQELSKYTQQQYRDQQLLNSITADMAECPTCGTPAATLQPVIEQAKARVPLLAEKSQSVRQRILAYQNYVQDTASHTAKLQRAENEVKHQHALMSQISEGPAQDCDEAALRNTVELQRTLEEGLAELQPTKNAADVEIARLEGVISQIDATIQAHHQELSTVPHYTQEQVAEAERNVGLWDQAAQQRRTAEQNLAVAESTLQQNKQTLQQALQIQARGEIMRGWVNLATSWRELLHKDAAPRFVAQQNLNRLQIGINESLEMFQTSYCVSADEGLSFIAHFSRGSRQPAERLSEGQKVILALAFRIALNSMFAENIGALYLDEPTAYLDEHHIRGFEPVLQQLKEFSTSRGLQVVIITHEQGLAPLFDSVVEL